MAKNVPARYDAKLPAVYTPKSPKAKLIWKMAGAVGLWEGISYLGDKAEDLFESIFDSMEDSGLSPTSAEKLPKDKQLQVLAVELARHGVDIDDAVLKKVASSSVAKGFREMRKRWVAPEGAPKVDAAQTPIATAAEEDDVSRLNYIRRMSDVCSMMGLSGPDRFRQLYEVAYVINTVRQVNVADAERHEKILGQIR